MDKRDDEVRRSKAKDGTTWFHCYATLCITMHGKRYTLAVTFVRKGASMATVLNRLLENVLQRGLRIACLTADKGFCNKACIETLRRHAVPFVIPLALRGRAARALQSGRRSYATTHTMAGITLPYAVVVKRNGGKYHGRKPGNQYFPYLYAGLDEDPKTIGKLYAKRGGIETTYRLANECRARTTIRNPAASLFLFGVALLLQNAWIKHDLAGQPTHPRPPGPQTPTRFLHAHNVPPTPVQPRGTRAPSSPRNHPDIRRALNGQLPNLNNLACSAYAQTLGLNTDDLFCRPPTVPVSFHGSTAPATLSPSRLRQS